MKSEHQQRVEELMVKAGQEIPDKPTIPSLEIRKLRATLILEEATECIRGLGFEPISNDSEWYDDHKLILTNIHEPNLEEIADGCWDTIVVTTGTLSACGIHDIEGQKEVDNNNLAKFGPGGYRRDDGKWVKPPNHPKPDIKGILERQK
jgi:predicted HAD superfamily Cof-like phosphohydrolase